MKGFDGNHALLVMAVRGSDPGDQTIPGRACTALEPSHVITGPVPAIPIP
ncbi:hypothetical protein J4G37_19290 [Microvirga sp. 3-52]|nr:hypothetical protein [Microvirga sp. 3-52]